LKNIIQNLLLFLFLLAASTNLSEGTLWQKLIRTQESAGMLASEKLAVFQYYAAGWLFRFGNVINLKWSSSEYVVELFLPTRDLQDN
jgi:hypothetical protein